MYQFVLFVNISRFSLFQWPGLNNELLKIVILNTILYLYLKYLIQISALWSRGINAVYFP